MLPSTVGAQGLNVAVPAEVERPRVVGSGVDPLRSALGHRDEAIEGHVLEGFQAVPAHAGLLQHGVGEPGREVGRQHASHGAALDDGPVKEAPGLRRGQERVHLAAPAGLAEDRDVPGIAAEVLDVVPHPFERRHDVEQTHVSRGRESLASDGREVEEADGAEAVVEADDDDVVAREVLAVVGVHLVSGADVEAAAVQPDHDGAFAVVETGSPDVQAQAVLALRAGIPLVDEGDLVLVPVLRRDLRARKAIGERGAHSFPGFRLRRGHEPPRAGGRGPIGNALEDEDVPVHEAAHLPERRLGDGGRVGCDDRTRIPGSGSRSRCGRASPRDEARGRHASGGLDPGASPDGGGGEPFLLHG